MRRLLSLLALLFLGPAMAQEIVPGPYYQPPPPPNETGNIVYTTLNPPPQGSQFNWSGFIVNNTNGGGLQGGNIPAYNTQTGTFIWGYMQGTVTYNFFGNSEWPSSGIQVDGFKYSWEYFNQDFSRGNILGNLSIFGTNNNILENINFAMPQTTQGWTLQSGQIDFADPYDRSEISRLQLSFTGVDDRFWAGYWGPQVRDIDVSIMYSTSSPAIPIFLYWNNVASEWGTFTLTEETTVRYGAQGVYIYATLQPGTYECSNSAWGVDPIGGVFKACEVGSDSLPQVNCLTDPGNVECTINQYTDPETIADSIVDDIVEDIIDEDNTENTNNDEVPVEEEDDIIEENNTENLEELLSDDTVEENTEEQEENAETVNNETAVIREIANEERASALSDNISVNVLELALSVAENASQATTTNETTVATQTARTANNNETTETKNEESKSDTETLLSESANETANELLDTGRNLNNQSLANIQAQSEQSSVDSNNVAETIAITSSDNRMTDRTQDTTQTTTEIETSNSQTSEVMASNNESNEISENIVLQSMVETSTETAIEEQKTETFAVEETTTVADVNVETTEQTFIVDEKVEQNNQLSDNSETELEFLQTIVASQSEQKKEDDSMTFNEDERLTLQSDINLSNAFNIVPNVNNLEQAGIITNKVEEKSDAEKRAEQIVAANAKEQEEINNNYMDADQSGILGAMTVDTDVSSYRSAMLNDNSLWYKPEDIYKNITYKDNVRNMYFLEKGNTDTYKQMVEEQYK